MFKGNKTPQAIKAELRKLNCIRFWYFVVQILTEIARLVIVNAELLDDDSIEFARV